MSRKYPRGHPISFLYNIGIYLGNKIERYSLYQIWWISWKKIHWYSLYQYQDLLSVNSISIMPSTPPHDMNKVINSNVSVIDWQRDHRVCT